jgi:HD superfamily phosphodiesterase
MDILRADEISSRMLGYVRDLLAPVDTLSKSGYSFPFRSRFSHIERVTEWALRLCEAEGGDAGIIAVASIFHDCGYNRTGDGHARQSVKLFLEFIEQCMSVKAGELNTPDGGQPAAGYVQAAADNAQSTVFNARSEANIDRLAKFNELSAAPGGGQPSGAYARRRRRRRAHARLPILSLPAAIRTAIASASSIDRICDVISVHSHKNLPVRDLNKEAVILMDADLLDEAGAMSVVFDCYFEASLPEYDYISAYARMRERYISEGNVRFHTGEAKRLHAEMRRYTWNFINGLGYELGLD